MGEGSYILLGVENGYPFYLVHRGYHRDEGLKETEGMDVVGI